VEVGIRELENHLRPVAPLVAGRLLCAGSRAAPALANRVGRISGSARRHGAAELERLYEQMDKVEISDRQRR
jgi:hypothetical protein